MADKPLLIDTHCHLNFDSYDANRDEIVNKAAKAGVTRIIIPAVDVESAHQALELSKQYEGIFFAVGVHPNSTSDFDDATLKTIESLSRAEKVVAIGEIGLDYYWDKSPKNKQRESFSTLR